MGDTKYLPLIEDMVWSYSRIESFDSCPYKFFLKYIYGCVEKEQFFATYGSFIHKLIERYYRGELTKDGMLTEYLTGFKENVRGTIPKESTVLKYIKDGTDYLRGFEPFGYNMVDVEQRVDYTIDGYKFVGYIDYLGERDGEYYIVDNKSRALSPRSGKAKPTASDRELDKMLRQLYLYSAAVKQKYGKFPKSLCFNCFRTGSFIEEPFRDEEYEKTVAWAKEKIEEIKKCDDFRPCVNYFSCLYICGLSDECEYSEIEFGRRHDM